MIRIKCKYVIMSKNKRYKRHIIGSAAAIVSIHEMNIII